MSDRLDDDLLEDLAEPEGPAYSRFEMGDLGDDLGDLGDDSDEFLGDLLGEAGDFGDLGDEDAFDQIDDAVAEVLQADDADEFLGGLRSILRKVAPIVSKVAPLLPIPGAGLIGKAADIVSKVAADEGDEMDAIDDLADLGDSVDSIDPVAPVLAGLAIKKAIPTVASLPHGARKQLVKATTAATKHVARHHGAAAARVMPAIVRHARRTAAKAGAPASALPHLVRTTAAKVARSPHLVRRMAQASHRMRSAPGMGSMRGGFRGMGSTGMGSTGMGSTGMGMGRHHRRHRRHHGYGGFGGGTGSYRGGFGGGSSWTDGGGSSWTGGGGTRSMSFRGPVRITIESI
jgi:hypothetical protein